MLEEIYVTLSHYEAINKHYVNITAELYGTLWHYEPIFEELYGILFLDGNDETSEGCNCASSDNVINERYGIPAEETYGMQLGRGI